jgi:hypothetical protein
MEKPYIIAIVGSLRKDSYNKQLAVAAQSVVVTWQNWRYWTIPMFRC